MPDDVPILPTVETLKELFQRSSDDKEDIVPPSPSVEEEIIL